MIKERQTFTVTRETANELRTAIEPLYRTPSTTAGLCLACLEKFLEKLLLVQHSQKALNLKKKIALSRIEQLGFHVAFKRQFIDTSNLFVREIFTAIDRTL